MQGTLKPPPAPEPLPNPIVDAHTHLDACGFQAPEQVAAAVERAAAVGVDRVVTVADDMASARWVVSAAQWDERVFGAVALHPTRTSSFGDAEQTELAALAASPRVVAIGETGLDHYWDYAPHVAQEMAFRWHIDLAKRLGKPLMIHDREAHEDVLRILAEEGAPPVVVLHCFSGDENLARRCADAGYLMSFAGTVSFRNAQPLRKAAALVPEELVLVETDAPFLAPHPFRGRRNEPYCLPYTLRALAEVRGVDPADLAHVVTANAERVFRLADSPGSVTAGDI